MTSTTFESLRGMLFSLAYRMLGSISDAEDILQEAFLRWEKVEEDTVLQPKAYLSSVVTRLCVEHLRKAYVRREVYVGPWLPEPLVSHESHPEKLHDVVESLSQAFLLVLETLSPVERAIFLLREVFDYKYDEISEILGKNEANCRQIAHRAKLHVQSQRPRFPASPEEHQRVLQQFLGCCMSGDMQGLLGILAEDVIFISDSGGNAKAALNIVKSAAHVARLAIGLGKKQQPDATAFPAIVNGAAGVISSVGGVVKVVLSIDVVDGKIKAIYTTVNPEKLRACQVSS